MITNRLVDRYIAEVMRYLPFWKKRYAKVKLKKYICNMIEAYCEGSRPTMRDVKEVLRIIGKPKKVAKEIDTIHNDDEEMVEIDWPALIMVGFYVLNALAVIFIIVGIASFGSSTPHNGLFAFGIFISLVLVLVRIFVPRKREIDLKDVNYGIRVRKEKSI
jgi:uncharacterized membrane protein